MTIPMNARVSLSCTPIGSGSVNDFARYQGEVASRLFYRKEHNTTWLRTIADGSGKLSFIIRPMDKSYDFDFVLFKANGDQSCDAILKAELEPIRSNISRTAGSNSGLTGLSNTSTLDYTPHGPNVAFSRSIKVTKGDEYLLAIDNVHGGTEGFYIDFSYLEEKQIHGFVKDEIDGSPIAADVFLQDQSTGKLIDSTRSDSVAGAYELRAVLTGSKEEVMFTVTAYKDGHMLLETAIPAIELFEPEYPPIEMDLPKLKVGKRMQLNSINFFGSSPKMYPGSELTLRHLTKLLQKNPDMQIKIEGHTNGCPRGRLDSQKLSEDRKNTVKDYLREQQIASMRIQTQGYNCTRMLYPKPSNKYEAHMNRRVEILVVHY